MATAEELIERIRAQVAKNVEVNETAGNFARADWWRRGLVEVEANIPTPKQSR